MTLSILEQKEPLYAMTSRINPESGDYELVIRDRVRGDIHATVMKIDNVSGKLILLTLDKDTEQMIAKSVGLKIDRAGVIEIVP